MTQGSIRFDDEDERLIAALQRRLSYSRSDTLRYAVRVATIYLSLPLSRPVADKLGTRTHRTGYDAPGRT